MPKPLKFHGFTSQYFGIWAVNISLSVLTLGIYSAWAKVRRQRYFLGTTAVDSQYFAYHGQPLQILFGRVVAVAFLLGLNIISLFSDWVHWGIVVAGALALPFMVNRAIRFQARMTSWRNVRFNYGGTYGWRSLMVFLVMPILAAISLGILVPVATKFWYDYVLNRLRFGRVRFRTRLQLGPLYRAYFKVLAAGLAIYVAAMAVCAAPLFLLVVLFDISGDTAIIGAMLSGLAVFSVTAIIVASAYRALVRNYIFGRLTLHGQIKFSSTLSARRLAIINLTNILAIVASLGLAIPWAAIRKHRYLCDMLAVLTNEPLDEFIQDQSIGDGAIIAEYSALDDIEFGF